MAARWADAGLDRLDAPARRRRARRRHDGRRSEVTTGGRDRRSRTRPATRRSPTAASRSSETAEHPGRARRPRPGRDGPRGRPRPRGAASGSGRARTRRIRTASAAGSSAAGTSTRHGPARAVHPPAGERRPRRRPLARALGRGRRAACGSTSTRRARSPSTHVRAADLAAATHDVDLVPCPETIVHLDAAHRGLGTASCGPDTLPEYLLAPGHVPLGLDPPTSRTGLTDGHHVVRRRPASSTSATTGSATSCASTRTGRLATCTSGRRSPPGRSYAHLVPRGFAGFANRVGDPVALEYPTTGSGDYRVPALEVGLADGSSVLDPRLREAPDRRRQAGRPARRRDLPVTYVEDDDEADTLEITLVDAPSGLAVDLAYTIFRDLPVVARSATHPQRRRRRPSGSTAAMSAVARPAGCSLGVRPAVGHVGARDARRRRARLRPGRQSVGSDRGASSAQHNPFIALRAPDDDRGGGRGLRVQPRLLGQLHRRGGGRPVRHDPRPDRDQPEHLRAGSSSRATPFTTPEAVARLLRRRPRRR